jgi:hypothetical protein
MGCKCSTHGNKNSTRFWSRRIKGRVHLESGTDGRVILKWILKETACEEMKDGLNWLQIGVNGGLM